MKKLLILICSFFLMNICYSQIIINSTKNSYQIQIFQNGKLIHDHEMPPGNIFKVEKTFPKDDIYFKFKRLSDICDNQNAAGKQIHKNARSEYRTVKFKNGWEGSKIDGYRYIEFGKNDKMNGWYYQSYLLPLYYCPQA